MHGRRSLNLELTPLDPDLERNIRRARQAQVEMGDNPRNPRVEGHGENQRNPEREEHKEYQDAREGNGEQDELMKWILQRHYGNCSHLLRSVPIRALCCHRLMRLITI
jgi:hypothetical protein